MGQLRDKIRTMVRNEFAARMIEEAKKGGYNGKTVYRSSKYIDIWNDLPMGKASSNISDKATKFDLVRRMMTMLNKADQERSTAPMYLEPEQRLLLLRFSSLLLMILMNSSKR